VLRCYINRVAILEAILLSAYLGGAAASNVRAQTPLFNLSFPVMFAIVVWASLVLHNKRLESVLFQAEGGGDR
jgi:hypothetical protein